MDNEHIQSKKKAQHWQMMSVLLVIYDIIAVILAYGMALWIRFDCRISMIPNEYYKPYIKFIPFYTLFCIGVFFALKLYKSIWRFASFHELKLVTYATVITSVVHTVVITVFIKRMPISYYVFGTAIQYALVLGVRFAYRFVLLLRSSKGQEGTFADGGRVMVIGAGNAGQMIIRDVRLAKENHDKVYCIIDDNPNKWGRYIDGIPVVGGKDSIFEAKEKYNITKIYIAIPSATVTQKRDILNICKETGCELKNLPGVYQMVSGEVTVSSMRNVAIEDLLGREQVEVDNNEIFTYLTGKTILVTGGGGSIGSELCRQIASHNPGKLIIFDVYENNAYDIQQELKIKFPELDFETIIGSVRDSRKITQVFEKYKPDVVYHAAAHKHVPLMEDSPCEAIKNNAIGTYKTAYAAMMNGCKRFVLISTDKAVNPTNIMGASKRICEMIVQSFDRLVKEGKCDKIPRLYAHADDEDGNMEHPSALSGKAVTEFVAVRFGNVLGSNGSVIPLFKKQIENGGPVTVTHPDIIRYFMTIPEAVGLVLQAGTYACGGEIFVLDMGEPVKIDDLARNLIKLSGFKPDIDIKIEYTGLRPGEKLYEEKLMSEEGLKTTKNKLIHIGCPVPFDEEEFMEQMKELTDAGYRNADNIREYVKKIVVTYQPAD